MTQPPDDADELDTGDDDGWSVDDVLREAEELTSGKKDRRTGARNGEHIPDTKMTLATRRQKVFDLKMQGKTLVEIAKLLGVNYNTVQKDFAAVTQSIDTTKWLRTRIDGDVQYLDKLISVLSPRALVGDLDAIETILKIMQRQHKILGMEAPKRVDIRLLVQQWAEREGLNPLDVMEVVSGMLDGG